MSTTRAFVVSLLAGLAVLGISYMTERTVHKLNSKANSDIRAAAAQERIADTLERVHPLRRTPSCLPPPSMLRASIKSVPDPDPEPCGESMETRAERSVRKTNRELILEEEKRLVMKDWKKLIQGISGNQ